jgi:hypothetical protein
MYIWIFREQARRVRCWYRTSIVLENRVEHSVLVHVKIESYLSVLIKSVLVQCTVSDRLYNFVTYLLFACFNFCCCGGGGVCLHVCLRFPYPKANPSQTCILHCA